MNESPYAETQKLICLSPKVIERIAWLRMGGTTGVFLAEKAEAIISKLKSGESWQAGKKITPRTQHGEKRIRKCIKYDFGWGFRLITVLRRGCLFICYLGPHNECDRWIADNNRIKEVDFGRSALYRIAPQKLTRSTLNPADPSETLDDLDQRLQGLSDQAMRRIFRGLVEARKRPLVSKLTNFSRIAAD